MSFGGLNWYNFWDRRTGALYGIRAHHPTTGRTIFAYGGKTFQRPWETRIRQHLWGGGQYNSVAKPWADTVLGWRPNGTVKECIDAGGVFLIMRPREISPFGLWWREILFAIWLRRPYYNVQWNIANPRRVLPSVAARQRAARDRGERWSGENPVGRLVGWWLSIRRVLVFTLSLLLLTGVGVLFFPGMAGSGFVGGAWDSVVNHTHDLVADAGGGLVLMGCAAVACSWPRRGRSRSRKTTRTRRSR